MNRRVKSMLSMTMIWLVFPIGLLALGFFVIGPRLGSSSVPAKVEQPAQPPADNPPAPDNTQSADNGDDSGSGSHHFSPPEVDVKVEPGAQFSVIRRGDPFRFKHRRKHKRSSRSIAPGAEPSAPIENGGAPAGVSDGGGSTDGGGTG